MSIANTTALRIVLLEGEGSQELSGPRRFEIFETLLAKGYALTRPAAGGQVAPPDASDVVVLRESDGSSPQGDADGSLTGVAADSDVQVHVRDIRDADADSIVGTVASIRDETGSYEPGQWKPWFPVIDYQRCTNCMQCLSFCLFDVYGVDGEGMIQVRNEDKCKTNCPACSRVCPDVAILFPKYGAGPINGDEVLQEDVDREKMKVDISALLGGDIYSMLRDRHTKAASRFSKERDEGKALKERQRCLKKLAEVGDIPAEVLMALPSPEEIKRRAEEAAAKAQAALEIRDTKQGTEGSSVTKSSDEA